MRKIQTPLDGNTVFNDGVLVIYAIENVAEKGLKPKYEKSVIHERVPFAYKTAGQKRKFYAQQEGKEFSFVVQVPREFGITEGQAALIGTQLHKITAINDIFSAYPYITEISLRKVDSLNECIA